MKNVLIWVKQKKYLVLLLTGIVMLFIMISILVQPSSKQPVQSINPSVSSPVSTTPSNNATPSIPFDPIEQDRGEEAFSKEQANIRNNYPWIDRLPLESKDYFVYFDVDKNAFVGILYPTDSSQNQIASETVSMKAEIRKSLTDLGIDTTKYEFEWIIKPENKTDE